MKRFLLITMLGLGAIGLHAENFTDLYKVTYNGRELTEGEVIEVSHAVMDPDYGDYTFDAVEIEVESRGASIRPLEGTLMASVPGTAAELKQRGESRFCYENSPEIGGSCLMYTGLNPVILGMGVVNVGGEGWVAGNETGFVAGKGFSWQIHYEYVADPVEGTDLKLLMTACDGTLSDTQTRSEEMSVILRFSTDLSNVSTLMPSETGETLYYTLDGRKVTEPTHGIYIARRGGKVTKIVK